MWNVVFVEGDEDKNDEKVNIKESKGKMKKERDGTKGKEIQRG
jgi:hypothetical protein